MLLEMLSRFMNPNNNPINNPINNSNNNPNNNPINNSNNNFTEEEQRDIDDMISMGFNHNDIIETYILCNRNKIYTISMLLENNI